MPVPYFGDFQRQTKDFWKSDKYSFGRQVHLSTQQGDTRLTAKVDSRDDNVTYKAIAKVNPEWGTLEVTQAGGKGTQVEAKAPKVWRDLDFQYKLNPNYSMETQFKYRKEDCWWNVQVKSIYNPSKSVTINDQPVDKRVCDTTIGVAVGDSDLNLSVGGEFCLSDVGNPGELSAPNTSLTNYKLGFLYTPTPTSGYSLIYRPEGNKSITSSLLFDFSLYRQCNDNCTVSARAEGQVSTTKGTNNQVPKISVGAKWKLNNGSLMGFLNSRRDWGAVYTTNITDSLTGSFGISNLRDICTTSYKFVFN